METRSQRRAQQTQRPAFPQINTQSAPGSAFQSSASVASLSTMNANNTTSYNQQQQQPGMLQPHQPGAASAPLPSPSGPQPNAYFGSLAQHQQPTSHPSHAQQQRFPQGQQMGNTYIGQRGDGGGMPETAPFLKDFNLVAEAAKRAQMACLARDLGDVGL